MLKDIFKIKDIKSANEKLKNDISNLEAMLIPEMKDFVELKN